MVVAHCPWAGVCFGEGGGLGNFKMDFGLKPSSFFSLFFLLVWIEATGLKGIRGKSSTEMRRDEIEL